MRKLIAQISSRLGKSHSQAQPRLRRQASRFELTKLSKISRAVTLSSKLIAIARPLQSNPINTPRKVEGRKATPPVAAAYQGSAYAISASKSSPCQHCQASGIRLPWAASFAWVAPDSSLARIVAIKRPLPRTNW